MSQYILLFTTNKHNGFIAKLKKWSFLGENINIEEDFKYSLQQCADDSNDFESPDSYLCLILSVN